MGVYGAARTMYTNVLGKGREVVFAADTPIQVRLAPGPSKNDCKPAAAIALALAVQTTAGVQPPAFRAETRLVVFHATARNARGALVTGLGRGAFTVYENGRRQPIALFRHETSPSRSDC